MPSDLLETPSSELGPVLLPDVGYVVRNLCPASDAEASVLGEKGLALAASLLRGFFRYLLLRS